MFVHFLDLFKKQHFDLFDCLLFSYSLFPLFLLTSLICPNFACFGYTLLGRRVEVCYLSDVFHSSQRIF